MVGLVVAMDLEVEALTKHFDTLNVEIYKNITFWHGKLQNIEVVIALSGIGKVNAALTATLLIEKFNPSLIISTGIAGGLNRLNIKDVLIVEKLCQHDFDTSAFGDPYGFLPRVENVFIECDKDAVSAFKTTLPNAKCGVLASGDQFINDDSRADFITKTFDALACDMESAAVAQCCHLLSVPFAAIRVISDNGNDCAEITFNQLKELASELNAKACLAAIAKLNNL